ncbi:MAG: polyphosphate kinase 1, partial [Planctomycetaceae bacterium]|nr:polyphosphate kinase 1 [Planctomycetaceae bacterium]
YSELKPEQLEIVDRFFEERAYPILTPMAVDPAHPNPLYHNRALYLAAQLHRHVGLGPKELFAVVQLPQVLPRLVPVATGDEYQFILLEEIIKARLPLLFGGFAVLACTTFRVTRDSDIELLEQESDDMLRVIEDRLKMRARGQAVRLEVSADGDPELIREIIEAERLHEADNTSESYSEIYRVPGPLDLTGLGDLLKIPGREVLRDPPFVPQPARGRGQRGSEDLFAAIRRNDIMLHHPYDSFDPVVEFVSRAAVDPNVLAIKQTLYRTSGDSPITRALIQAAEKGKHVTALVELKARFDEENNVSWARQLERAGVHVVFGFMDLKTHCKLSLVVRREANGVRRYVHLGTGNYNPTTALIYTDIGLFTADEQIAADASAVFNLLTGYSQGHKWHKLIVAPTDMHHCMIEMIEQQTQLAREGNRAWIFAKINSLVDYRVIEALYRASQAGVPIDLVIRGVCGLRPGLPGISENIRVRSIVDRFLEHSRIFVFGWGNQSQVFAGSADWMPRNFYRRVEVMFPIEAPPLKERILQEIVPLYLSDNVKARFIQADGTQIRAPRDPNEPAHRCQDEFLAIRPPVTAETAGLNGSGRREGRVVTQ